MLFGLLLLLLGLPFTWGQTEATLMGWKDNSTAQPHKAFNFSTNGTFIKEETDHNVTFEEEESFQNQEEIHHYSGCNEEVLKMFGEFCWNQTFHTKMMYLGKEKWCNWDMVISHYHHLVHCLEEASALSSCYYPGPVVQKLFVDIHKQYFSSCSSEEQGFPDTPPNVILILTLLPISILPVAVYMVICKTNIKD